MQIIFPWPALAPLGFPGLGPMRTHWAAGQGSGLGGTILLTSLGHQGRGGRGRDGSPRLLLTRLLKHQRRTGQAFIFHSMGMSAGHGQTLSSLSSREVLVQ